MDFDFEANGSVDDLMLVPEQFRGAYVEKDGAHVIADQFKPFTSLTSGLAKSLKAAREDAKKAKSSQVDLSLLADYGATPAEIAEKVSTTISELNDKLSKGAKIDPDKLRQEIKASFDGQLRQKDDSLSAMQRTLEKHLVTAEATRAIAALKGVPELLMPHILSQVKVVEANGEYRVAVVDKDGDQRISGVTGQLMSIGDLVQEMKANAVFGRAFESEAAAGGGARPGTARTSGGASPRVGTVDPLVNPLAAIEAGLNAGLARGR